MRAHVEPQTAGGEHRGVRARRGAQLHRDPREQLTQNERLRHVVRRPAEQQLHLVVHAGLRADDDHRDARKPRQQRLAREAGQHQVEQNEVGLFPLQKELRLGAGVRARNAVALRPERLLQKISDVLVVIDH